MDSKSLLNIPRTPDEWNRWSWSHAQEHKSIIEAIRKQTGNITSVTLTNGGSGYTSIPNISLNEYGSGASFEVSIQGGVIQSIYILEEGTGYRSTGFEISGGGGSGGAATITVNTWASLIEYQLDPINFSDKKFMLDWMERHQQSHVDMDSVTNVQSQDLQDIDLSDPKKLESFIYSNWQEHYDVNQILKI